MNTNSGRVNAYIVATAEASGWVPASSDSGGFDKSLKMVDTPPPVTARNHPCPCGSGKKYKRCCIESTREHPV